MRPTAVNKEFNMVIVGVGGQGQLTLLKILAEAAILDGYDVKTSELHGLSQRGGQVEVQIKIGEEVFSPLIPFKRADFVLALEAQESLRALRYASEKTSFLLNDYIIPIPFNKNLSNQEILREINKIAKGSLASQKKIRLIPASKICKEALGNDLVAGVYLLSLASSLKLIPIKPGSILRAIKKIIPEKYLSLNLKAFDLAEDNI